MNVELEHVGRDRYGNAGIGDVHDTSDSAFNRRASENDVSLLFRVAELGQILDRIKAGAAHRHCRVVVELLTRFVVNANPLKDEEVAVMRVDGADFEQWVDEAVFVDAALDKVDMQVDPAGHFDGAAEGD